MAQQLRLILTIRKANLKGNGILQLVQSSLETSSFSDQIHLETVSSPFATLLIPKHPQIESHLVGHSSHCAAP